jgi:hypothetical protein
MKPSLLTTSLIGTSFLSLFLTFLIYGFLPGVYSAWIKCIGPEPHSKAGKACLAGHCYPHFYIAVFLLFYGRMQSITSTLSATSLSSTKNLENLGCNVIFVDTESSLLDMIRDVNISLKMSNYINVDFEGVNLCKSGKICLGQFHVAGSSYVYIVDFVVLTNPFISHDSGLQKIFSSSCVKVFYDPRNDMDALTNILGVTARNCLCLQVVKLPNSIYIDQRGCLSAKNPPTPSQIRYRTSKSYGRAR